ncbi:MAG: uracil-DNA glycosylase [Caldimicrobium sp.]|nr:uracil-DNA glycosylase [Caldimicrobium sp.]MCX7613019.1 uracil-DNA glycosylase [Caldimicrobium sp.]MDW8182278.1 uracil-DNA glycosylase [Caldimicrobium sp.]
MSKEAFNPLVEIRKYFQYLQDLGYSLVPNCKEFSLKMANGLTSKEADLLDFFETLSLCQDCGLYRTRKQTVIDKNFNQQDIMLVGEYPSREDDFNGYPLSGSIREHLQKMLLSIGLRVEDFYTSLVVKCKPPYGRLPEEEEISLCKRHLLREITLLRPKLILAFGNLPPRALLGESESIITVRGKPFKFRESVIIFTYHPNYMQKNPAVKRLIWEDLKTFKKLYESLK